MKDLIAFFEYMARYIVPALLTLEFALVFFTLVKILLVKNNNKASLSKSNTFQSLALDNSEVAFLILEKGNNMPIYTNKSFDTLVGLKKDKIIEDYEALKSIFSYDVRGSFKKKYDQWDRKSTLKFVFFNVITNRWLELKAFYQNEKYEIISFNDVTEFIDEKDKIMQELEKAEVTSRSKTEFLSKMSHDIRTPMNGILGMLSLMKINIKQKKDISQYIEKAESLSQFLLSLINDILDISRIEAGKITLAKESFSLNEFAKKIDTMFRKTIEEKGIDFKVELADIKNPYVIGDEFRISQVIINFISNAIKFTEKGEIQFKIAQVNSYNDMGSFLFSVKDSGKGIEPDFIKNLFKPFEQEDAKIAKKYGGSGLGMAIADQIVHLMKGEIIVDSVVGEGTTFTVYVNLPINASLEKQQSEENAELAVEDKKAENEFSWKDIRILLAEDNEINAEIFVEMLDLEGAKVDVAQDGQKVIDKFIEMGKDYYDIILMDIQMPVKNGWEAAKAIRQIRELNGNTIPIIALSADAFVEDKRHSIEAGMNGHLSKPIDYGQLKKEVGNLLMKA